MVGIRTHHLMSSYSVAADIFNPQLPGKSGQVLAWSELYGSSFGLAIVSAAHQHSGPIIVVTPDNRLTQSLEEEIRFYMGQHNSIPLLSYPDWECLVYDRFSPHQDIISQRLRTLASLPVQRQGIIILSISNLMQRTPPQAYIAAHSFSLACGDILDTDKFRLQLETAAYRHVSQVYEHGEYAIRGGIIDLFPMGSSQPYRIDLFGDEVDSIRLFDTESQRSAGTVNQIELLPAREFPMTEQGINRFRQSYREKFSGDPQQSLIYNEVSKGNIPPGTEFYMPLFFDDTSSFLDYLPVDSLLIMDKECEQTANTFQTEVIERFQSVGLDPERPALPPEALYQQYDELKKQLTYWPLIEYGPTPEHGEKACQRFATRRPDTFDVDIHAEQPYQRLLDFLAQTDRRVMLACETTGRRENLKNVLNEQGVFPDTVEDASAFFNGDEKLALCAARLDRGLSLEQPELVILSEIQLYGDKVFQRRRRSKPARDPESVIRSLADLNIGDPVIHETQGVGRYIGLQTLDINNSKYEFLTLEYRDGDKLYVPVMSLHLVSRFTAAHPDSAPLHKLGGKEWEKTRRKAQKKAYDTAVELLAVQALRDAREGHAFPTADLHYDHFVTAFPFEETPDQARAIDDVIQDMTSSKPMDRLVCGDVGFGKTEVALRASFFAVHGEHQVALLVPTTLLAQQHYENFRDRFANLPVRVELLSRFRTKKESDAVIEGMKNGSVDIVIGTHRLLQKDIAFKRLGLMILDEEQRFGVRHKEILKKKRSQVDILTLTATPIPRTLNLSLSGLREISIIATAPRQRLAIRTFVVEWSEGQIREGFLREIRRGGQIYFLHNEVRSMPAMQAKLEEIIPEAHIRMAHGQMAERALEHIMQDFYHQRFNVLLCSTIIESGIDIPSANTIFINHADHFGLSQLHQLRGRVGRSHHQAYCYVMVQSRKLITADAARRLDALEQLDDLGAGFALAMHDMEIRGTGELLGESQSGVIDEVGFNMYTDLLNRAIGSLKAGKELSAEDIENDSSSAIEIDLQIPARLPEDYLPDVHTRLIMYKRIANAKSTEELYELQIEMIDRFGLLPDEAKALIKLTELRIEAMTLGITEIRIGEAGGRLKFKPKPNIEPMALIQLLQTGKGKYRMEGPQILHLMMELSSEEQRLQTVKELLNELGSGQAKD
ncbi:transcription-repair-coupling factor [bacterium BMS3Abin11]|nr:transcription-repair-coupling factor [bacterium BMS3Abin11]GMT40059.1 MAG: transcription-repair-coupling factor [bacterium]